jgi:hypothetical protein
LVLAELRFTQFGTFNALLRLLLEMSCWSCFRFPHKGDLRLIESSLASLEQSYTKDDLETRVKRWMEESEDRSGACVGANWIRSILPWNRIPSLIHTESLDPDEWLPRRKSEYDSYGSSM